MNLETEFTTAKFVILKVVKKWKKMTSFSKRRENFLALAKFCQRKLAILQFASTFTLAFAVFWGELQGLLQAVCAVCYIENNP